MRKKLLAAAVFAAGLCGLPAFAAESFFPQLNIIVGATPGGGFDLTGRSIEKTLVENKLVDVPVVVENRPGAGGAVGWASMNRFAGNPAYISPISAAFISADLQNVGRIKIGDFTPIAMLVREDLCIGLNPKGRIKTIDDLVKALKTKPDEVRLGFSTAIGTQNHIAIALVAKAIGVDIRKVRTAIFKSAGESTVALLGANIDVTVSGLATFAPYRETGELVCAAIASPKRAAAPHDAIPTLTELGIPVEYSSYRGIIAPKNLSPADVAKWEDLVRKMLATPSWKGIVKANYWTDDYMSSADMKSFLEKSRESTKQVLTDLGIIK